MTDIFMGLKLDLEYLKESLHVNTFRDFYTLANQMCYLTTQPFSHPLTH